MIRDLLRVISSYAKVRSKFSFEELGIQQQLDLFHLCADKLGEAPPVIDAERCLVNPKNVLTTLCQRLNISFSSKMLEWPSGGCGFVTDAWEAEGGREILLFNVSSDPPQQQPQRCDCPS